MSITPDEAKLIELKRRLDAAEALEYWQLVRRIERQIVATENKINSSPQGQPNTGKVRG